MTNLHHHNNNGNHNGISEQDRKRRQERRRVWFMEVDERREYAVSREERDDKRRAYEEVRAGRRRNEKDAAMEREMARFLTEMEAAEKLARAKARLMNEVAPPTRSAEAWIREAMMELPTEKRAAEGGEAHEARVPAKRSRGDKGRQQICLTQFDDDRDCAKHARRCRKRFRERY